MPRKMDADSDSEAPDELTAEQAIKQDHEIRKLQIENYPGQEGIIIAHYRIKNAGGSGHRGRHSGQVVPRMSKKLKDLMKRKIQPGCSQATLLSTLSRVRKQEMKTGNRAMNEIPTQLFSSDTEGETIVDEPVSRKKKHKHFGVRPVILKNVRPSHCLKDSMEFLKKRRSQILRWSCGCCSCWS
ncbi:unnamed protein product [Spirodela intermedia]|uniref:Uncharacterized protein n=1 Tax=Spirodela intermedia TaxID=51605 RepID=A0A7I8LE41_SPIIN|nr:unnamed protein product [Spirodela intermedia]